MHPTVNVFDQIKNNPMTVLGAKYTARDIQNVWEQVSIQIIYSLKDGKGVVIKGLGTFTLSNWSLETGNNNRTLDVWRPIFIISRTLVEDFDLHQPKQYANDAKSKEHPNQLEVSPFLYDQPNLSTNSFVRFFSQYNDIQEMDELKIKSEYNSNSLLGHYLLHLIHLLRTLLQLQIRESHQMWLKIPLAPISYHQIANVCRLSKEAVTGCIEETTQCLRKVISDRKNVNFPMYPLGRLTVFDTKIMFSYDEPCQQRRQETPTYCAKFPSARTPYERKSQVPCPGHAGPKF